MAQAPSADQIISASQKYHDPKGSLTKTTVILTLNEPRPGGADRISVVTFNNKHEFFSLERSVEEGNIYMEQDKEKYSFSFNGSTEFSTEIAEKYKLNKERLTLMKNYYLYLWMLPIKLNDPGTIVHPTASLKDFFGKNGYEIKVTYSPKVGKDIWYFYFDLEDFELIGYRFYHDESKNDGEYILLDQEVQGNKLRLPAIRKWYKHVDDEYLGEDQLKSIEIKSNK